MSLVAATEAAIARLAEAFGPRLSRGVAVRHHHARDPSYHPARPADAVVFAQSTDEVALVLAVCGQGRVPVIPFGAGTSVEGQIQAVHGGICLDLSMMNAIVAVRPDDFDAVVQPGVTRRALNSTLRDQGLFFPVDPGADATLGGMASTRASGTNAVRYGTMRDAVMALQVVLPDGQVIRTGSRARKSAMGYDLTRLMIGAEGTLGVITELTLRLHPIPERIGAAICPFTTLEGALAAVVGTLQAAVPVARIELLDEVSIEASNLYSKLDLPVTPTLFLEFHGTPAGVAEQAELVEAISAEHGGGPFTWTTLTEERERLWRARHDQNFAAKALRPGSATFATDACVPFSALADNILAARRDVDQSFLRAKILGHVGDGNFHVSYLVLPDRAEEIAEAERLAARVVERAQAAGGTASGEHGVGIGKLAHLAAEHGEAVAVMQAIKAALDPAGIMNPGKLGWRG